MHIHHIRRLVYLLFFYHVILATWCNWLDFYWCWIKFCLSLSLSLNKKWPHIFVKLHPIQGWGEYQIYEYEYKYEYLIIAWVRVRVRVLVDEYEYKYEYRPMIYILYKQQYCIFQSLKRESSHFYNPGTKVQLPIVHVNSLCQYISQK